MVRIGITGGPGSGKSTVAGVFKRRGIVFTDLDYLSRVVVEPGQPAFKKILDYFGQSILDKSGFLDRSVLRKRLILNLDDKKVLESIIHPEVFRLLEKESEKNESLGEKFFGVEAPLLFEAKMDNFFDYIITVYASYKVQVERVMSRDEVTREGAEGLVNSQLSLDEKASMSDFVIYNNGGVDGLEGQVDEFMKRF